MLNIVREKTMAADWTERARGIAERIAGCAVNHDIDDSFVEEGFEELEKAGFFTALVPAELGGGGASVSEIADALRTIGAACSSTALAASMRRRSAAGSPSPVRPPGSGSRSPADTSTARP